MLMMKRLFSVQDTLRPLLLAALLLTTAVPLCADSFVGEPAMKAGLLQMLARFTEYMKADFEVCREPNADGEAAGCFRGERTMASDERGVRPNADMGMVCAFLAKYGQDRVTLPHGVTWDDVRRMARQSLVYAYSTHKANRLMRCSDGRYWGSTAQDDHVWESSLWALSVAYSAFFQWDTLTDAQRHYIYCLLRAECHYELERTVPTAFDGDTKAEENGWEAGVLAVTLGLFPDDALAPQWFERLRLFAINSYSHPDDANDTTVADPGHDALRVCDLYRGANLYPDLTLQNHRYFHTSYQNVVIQELGEAALALQLFQQSLHGTQRWHTNSLMHNNDRVMREVLCWLALADGELAMPNGNDWSLFLYDQLTSYSTNACFLRDADALMLENRAYQMIRRRQQTTPDGSWLLRPDVGARRMGVEAHRVMMTWLMHEVLPTASMTPASWPDFRQRHGAAKMFPSQNIVRAMTPQRFTCFSWSQGLKSYTGYVAPANDEAADNLVVPFRDKNTGNFLGHYEVEGKKTDAVPVVSGRYRLQGEAFVMNGELQTNDGTLNHRFALYSTPGNAVVLMDYVRANEAVTILKEKGAPMAVSVDIFTATMRHLYAADGHRCHDGSTFTAIQSSWTNVDDALGVVSIDGQTMAFGECKNNNSIMTARLYGRYDDHRRQVAKGEVVGRHATVWYVDTDHRATAALSARNHRLKVAEGWGGCVVYDPGACAPSYLLLSNFAAADSVLTLTDIRLLEGCPEGCPVFEVPTAIGPGGSTATFAAQPNTSVVQVLTWFVRGEGVTACQQPDGLHLVSTDGRRHKITVTCLDGGKPRSRQVTVGKHLRVLSGL